MIMKFSTDMLKKALKGSYRGLMKYSGTTFILDNAGARLNKQKDETASQRLINDKASMRD